MKLVKRAKNNSGLTVRVYQHSFREIAKGASRGFFARVVKPDGTLHYESYYFNEINSALQAAWNK